MKKMTFLMVILACLLLTGSAFAHNLNVTAGGLNASNFKLSMTYTAGNATEASVASSHPDNESIYRASWYMNIPAAEAANFPSPSFTYFFQTFGTGFFTGPAVGWAIRCGIHRVNGNSNARCYGRDNQTNRRGTGGCVIPDDTEVLVEVNYSTGQANSGNIQLNTYTGGSPTPDCTRNAIGGITNGFIRIVSQLFITKPDNNAAITTDYTIEVDEFASFRTLSAPN